MAAKDAIEASFRKLVEQMQYEKITVTEICRNAHISRKTFYANFDDKEAIVDAIFEEGAIAPMRALNDVLTEEQAKSISSVFTENLYSYFQSEKKYYQRLVRPMFGHDDTFIRVVTRAIAKFNDEKLVQCFQGAELEREYVSYFFASSQAMFVQKWIADGMPMGPKELADLYNKMAASFWFNENT